jgi:hypothetical protein
LTTQSRFQALDLCAEQLHGIRGIELSQCKTIGDHVDVFSPKQVLQPLAKILAKCVDVAAHRQPAQWPLFGDRVHAARRHLQVKPPYFGKWVLAHWVAPGRMEGWWSAAIQPGNKGCQFRAIWLPHTGAGDQLA